MPGLTHSRARLLIGASVTVLSALPFAAIAQTAATTATPAPAAAPATVGEVVVTARRKALQTATERKRNSDTVVDSIVADEAGKLPDTSLTEVLQRVSGVTIDRFASLGSPDQYSYEGTGIQVRGLSGVTGLLNGREIFSANGGGGLNWSDVTPELMSAVDVYKESTADLIEGGLGGAVDLRTHLPFDYKKPEVDLTVGASYGDYVKQYSPSVSLLLTDRWDTPIGEFGALVDLSYSEYRQADSFIRSEPYYATLYQTSPTATPERVYAPGGFDWGEDSFDRRRKGVYAAFQWRPTGDLTFWQTDFYSNYKQNDVGGGVYSTISGGNASADFAPGSATFTKNGVFLSGTGIQGYNGSTLGSGSSDNNTPSNNSNADFSQGFIWTPTQKLRVSGAIQVVDSGTFSGNYGYGLTTNVNVFNMNVAGNLPVDSFGATTGGVNGAVVNSTAADAAVNNIAWRETKNTALMEAGNLDVSYDLGDGFFKELKFGARYANQSETDNTVGTYWAGTDESWDYPADQKTAATNPSLFVLNTFPNFFQGKTPAPSSYFFVNEALLEPANYVYLQNIFSAGKGPNANGSWNGSSFAALGAPTTVTTQTDKFDAYAETKFGHDNIGWLPAFTGNIGVRAVTDWVNSRGDYTQGGTVPTYLYPNQAAAAASLAQLGGLAGYLAYQQANPGSTAGLPGTEALAYTSGLRSASMHYTRVLPSFNVAFKPTPKWVFRIGVSQTMSPPDYSDITALGTLTQNSTTNPYNGTVTANGKSTTVTLPGILNGYNYTAGNTALKPAISTNEDISLEWYPSSSTTAHIDVFNKDIKDYIVFNPTSFNEPVGILSPTGTVTNTVVPISESFDQNSDKDTSIKGFELDLRTYFDFLPGPFKGIGVDTNYTYISSHNPGQQATDINGNPITGLPVVALSKTSYNLALLYDLGPVDARLAYSWRSKYLATSTGNGTGNSAGSDEYQFEGSGPEIEEGLPVYAGALGQLDGSISYKFNSNLGVSFDVRNITDNIPKTYMEILPGEFVTRSWYISDRTFALTLHGHF